jgi:glucosamine-6-phosphate deaminase
MSTDTEPAHNRMYGRLWVGVFAGGSDLGRRAAQDLAESIHVTLRQQKTVSIIFASANSQLDFMAALRARMDIPWDRIVVFHMDEYVGLPASHPASFRCFMYRNLIDAVKPRAFFPINADAPETAAEMERYVALIDQYPPDICVMGIGENGHLAFNEPPADFRTRERMRVVTLDPVSRAQQVGEGHFPKLDDVPRQALSLTIPALLAPKNLFVVVPELRKAEAVKAALEGPVTPQCPASILREQPQARLYLDLESASLLSKVQ